MSLDEHSQQGQTYQAPPPQQKTSGLAIAGLILAFLAAPLGFILSLIAVFTTGAGKAKGRGLAIAGIIVSVIIMGGAAAVFALVFNSTVADPGCTAAKSAILDNQSNDPASLQKASDGLKAAVGKAKHDDVRAAVQAMSDDYAQLLDATKTGNVPPGITDKVAKDGEAFDKLCSVGN